MPGWLLEKDAIDSRQLEWDDWMAQRRRTAEQAAQAVQQVAQPVVQPIQQAVQEVSQRLTAEQQARQNEWDRWMAGRPSPESLLQDALRQAQSRVTPASPPPQPSDVPQPLTGPLQALRVPGPPLTDDLLAHREQIVQWLRDPANPDRRPNDDQVAAWLAQEPLEEEPEEELDQEPSLTDRVGAFLSPLTTGAGDVLGAIGEAPGLSEADRPGRRAAIEQSPIGQAYQSDIRREILPNITEPNHPFNVMADLQAKYGDDLEAMTPEDKARWQNATMALGGATGPLVRGAQPVAAATARGLGEAVEAFVQGSQGSVGPQLARRLEGSASAQFATRLGGTAAGVAGAEATLTPEERADPLKRIGRDLLGGAAGFAVPTAVEGAITSRGLPTRVVRDLVEQTAPQAMQGPLLAMNNAEKVAQYGLGNLLWGPLTHLWNVGSQAVELGRRPILSVLAGHGDEAAAGMRTALASSGDASRAFLDALVTGRTMPRPGEGIVQRATPMIGRVDGVPIPLISNAPLRALGAFDDFFRVLGSAQGAGAEAQRLIREAGLNPNQGAQIKALLQSQAARIGEAGQEGAGQAVFASGGLTPLGRWLSETKGRLLASDSRKDQASGILLDALVPFSRTPEVVWSQGILRTPVLGTLLGDIPAVATAVGTRDWHAAQMAASALLLNSVIGLQITNGVRDGNITGPQDPEHPSSIQIGGKWYSYKRWGQYALPLGIPAAFAEAFQRGTRKSDAEGLERAMDGLDRAAGATAEMLLDSNFASGMLHLLTAMGQGSVMDAIGRTATSYLADRGVPAGALLNFIEQSTDPYLRDAGDSSDFPSSVLKRIQQRTPGLAGRLPTRLDPATGREMPSLGLGAVVTGEQRQLRPYQVEIARLNRLGYQLALPKEAPKTISYRGAEIHLTPEESRALTQARGERLERVLEARMNSPYWNRLTDDQRARFIERALNSVTEQMLIAWRKITPVDEQRERQVAGQRVVGRLVNQSELGLADLIPGR